MMIKQTLSHNKLTKGRDENICFDLKTVDSTMLIALQETHVTRAAKLKDGGQFKQNQLPLKVIQSF